MDFDIRALRQVAVAAGVPDGDVATVIEAALKDAYATARGTSDDLTVTVDDEAGTVDVRDSDGARVSSDGLGVRAAAAARQAIVSWLRNLERVRKVGPWAGREGQAIRATVKATSREGEVRLDVQGVAAVMPAGEAIAGEVLAHGQEVTVLLLNANVTDRGSIRLTVSRRQPTLVSAMFEGHLSRAGSATKIVCVAREPGVRTKVAFAGPGPDPRADLIGPIGSVVRAVVAELGGEPVDLIAHSTDLAAYAAAALSPALVRGATLTDPVRRVVTVELAPDQIAVAHGAGGVNLRLASRLTGARIELMTTPAASLAA